MTLYSYCEGRIFFLKKKGIHFFPIVLCNKVGPIHLPIHFQGKRKKKKEENKKQKIKEKDKR